MLRPVIVLLIHATTFFLIHEGAVWAGQGEIPPSGPRISTAAPDLIDVELALDEVELAWEGESSLQGRGPAAAAAGVVGARIVSQQRFRAVVSLEGVRNLADLARRAEALRAANPQAEIYPVVYVPGLRRSPATRRLLNREVRLLMEPGKIPVRALAGLAKMTSKPPVPMSRGVWFSPRQKRKKAR